MEELIKQWSSTVLTLILTLIIGGMLARTNKKIDKFTDKIHELDKTVAVNNETLKNFKEMMEKAKTDINSFFTRAKKIESHIDVEAKT